MRGRNAAACVAAALTMAATAAGTASADEASLFRGPGVRPGPEILYRAPARAPQLENAAPWRAAPILISGASAYRRGEFLYQDFLYDDHGARATRDPRDPRVAADLFSPPNGTYTYPTAAAYAGNAADLVELRVKPLASETAFRLTLNTLLDPEVVAATIALGSSPTPRTFPHGANVAAPAELFLTWHGSTAELVDAASGRPLSPAPSARVDLRRRQVELRVPHAAWNPARSTVRMAAGVGLWDRAAGSYLLPGAEATAERPGGAAATTQPAAFFNVAFRHAEPVQGLQDPRALSDPAWWRDRLQGHALAAGDLSSFSAQVDFARLARGDDDELHGRPEGVPRSGRMNRILVSHFENRQGTDFATRCGPLAASCPGQLRGRLQPYAVYVPPRRPARGRYQLTLLLHSLTANYNQFSGSRNQRQFGDRTRPSIVITPAGRGPDGFYRDAAGADTFEVWADVARLYRLDPERTAIAGYSMGGFGTFKLAAQYPDLFARAQPTVGALDVPREMVASLRWIPFLMWNARADELVRPVLFEPAADALRDLGYRYELDVFAPIDPPPPAPTPQHVTLAINDQFAPAARFLGSSRVVRDPPRVTYVRNAALDHPSAGTTADHAYWVSAIRFRDGGATATASIDVRSGGFGVGDAPVRTSTGRGTLTGGALGARPFESRSTAWGRAPRRRVRDELRIEARNVASIRVDATRARVSCRARLRIRADGPLRVRLVNCPSRRR